jgi:hypothetical protein
MSDEISELRERMEYYRRRSKSVPFRPIAAAYAEAADQLEDSVTSRESNACDAHQIKAGTESA